MNKRRGCTASDYLFSIAPFDRKRFLPTSEDTAREGP